MPELPEVETIRRGLVPRLTGQRVISVALGAFGLRRPFPPQLGPSLEQRCILGLRRRAKYLLMDIDSGRSVLIHLGMSGRLLHHPAPAPPPRARHDHVVLGLGDGGTLVFNDSRRFGLVDLVDTATCDRHPLLASLGPEPLDADFTGPLLASRLAERRTPIKAALLDQRVVAGLGNIYVSESLFLAGISPLRLAGDLSAQEVTRLVAAIQQVLADALAAGGSTLRDYVQAGGEQGWFQHRFSVYNRAGEPCPGCTCGAPAPGKGVLRLVQGGRSTYYCPQRQG